MKPATYRKKIIKNMQTVGTYRDEFKETINTLANIYADLDAAREQFAELGGQVVVQHTNKNGSTNIIKHPIYKVIEDMETMILNYNRELGLTPRGLKQLKSDGLKTKKKSALESALERL